MKDEHDIARSADWHRRGEMLDDLLAFLPAWGTITPVSWDSEVFFLPPVHADLRPGPGGRAAQLDRRCQRDRDAPGRPQRHRLARFKGLPDEVADHLWSIARRAAHDAGRDPAGRYPAGEPRAKRLN
jgi:hypothetical protein